LVQQDPKEVKDPQVQLEQESKVQQELQELQEHKESKDL
jgi:hypothetical protein